MRQRCKAGRRRNLGLRQLPFGVGTAFQFGLPSFVGIRNDLADVRNASVMCRIEKIIMDANCNGWILYLCYNHGFSSLG